MVKPLTDVLNVMECRLDLSDAIAQAKDFEGKLSALNGEMNKSEKRLEHHLRSAARMLSAVQMASGAMMGLMGDALDEGTRAVVNFVINSTQAIVTTKLAFAATGDPLAIIQAGLSIGAGAFSVAQVMAMQQQNKELSNQIRAGQQSFQMINGLVGVLRWS